MDFQGSWLRGERCAFKRDAHKRGRSSARGRGRSPSRKGNSVMTFLRERQDGALQKSMSRRSMRFRAPSLHLLQARNVTPRSTLSFYMFRQRACWTAEGENRKFSRSKPGPTVEGKAKRTATWLTRLQEIECQRRQAWFNKEEFPNAPCILLLWRSWLNSPQKP